MSAGASFRPLEHTADIGLEARAATREELFVIAAKGLKVLLFGASPAIGTIRRSVVVEAGNFSELLVAWLNEIIFFCENAQAVPATFAIEELTEHRLAAVISGEPFDPARHTAERTAKAVTYHRLLVEERQDGWSARVYIDL